MSSSENCGVTPIDQRPITERQAMFGGEGDISLRHVAIEGDLPPQSRLFAEVTVPAGASVGIHPHDGEREYYVVQSGTGIYHLDEGSLRVSPGDVTLVRSGQSHGITNDGDEPLVFTALVLSEARPQ